MKIKFTFWKLVFLFLMAAAFYATVVRFTRGLGAATHLSDQFPWGLWILAAIDRHVSQLHQPRLLTQLQGLAKQPRQCLQMPFAKFRQRTMVGMFVDRQVSKRYILVGLRLDLARTVAPCAVGVQ